MNAPRCLAVLVMGMVTLGLFLQLPPMGRSEEPTDVRQKEIAAVEKEIANLNRKLTDLKNGVAKAPVKPPVASGLSPEWTKELTWRCIGPAAMGGRIVAFSVFEADPCTYWVATASGGLLKTVNNGTTFEHQFDHEATVSVGDVCVAPSDRNIVWVGTGENNPRNSVSYGDGVYKSTDGGKTWKNMGLKATFQIGKIIVHPKDPNVVYVGALGRLYGPNPERGLYKTSDGGKTWHKVLFVDDKTGVIDMRMNPANPEELLVATWERQRDEYDSHRGLPAPADGYDGYDPIKKWGPGSGLHKTTDGGKSFKKITKGLPASHLGRMGIDYYRKDPKTVYLVVDCAKIGMGNPPRLPLPQQQGGGGYLGVTGDNADAGARLTEVVPDGPAAKAGLKVGDIVVGVDNKVVVTYRDFTDQFRNKRAGDKVTLKVARNRQGQDMVVVLGRRPDPLGRGGRGGIAMVGLDPRRPNSFMYSGQRENVQNTQGPNAHEYGGVYQSTDGGESWTRLNSVNPRPMYFSQIRVDPSDNKHLYVLGISLYRSSDGGKTFRPDGGTGVHPDQHALWIDPKDGRHMLVGCDGGFYATYDRMATWDFLNHVAIGQFYHVAVDTRRPYRVYGGLQDNGSWGGPSHTFSGGPINEDWIMVNGGDGFFCRVDPTDPELVYAESQDGFIMRRNLRTGESASIRPRGLEAALGRLLGTEIALSLTSGLLGQPASYLGGALRSAQQLTQYRYNWNTPFLLSAHNPRIIYCAGNHVFRSVKQGDDLRPISPEITRTKRGSATALAESPRSPEVIWVGTDDGYVHFTRDGGNHWELVKPVGLPGPRGVASIEASRFADGRAYVVFDAHRSNDDNPYVYVTEDYGQTWKSLRANLPVGSTRVLREDVENANLLYLGTEFGIWVSIDRGDRWTKLNNNLPTVAVHEVAVHPTAGEIVAATHGRSLWVLDVTALRQITSDVLKAKANLYRPSAAVKWRTEPARGSIYGTGARKFTGQNPPVGAPLYYSLATKAGKLSLKVVDFSGKTVRDLEPKNEPGLHHVVWDLRGNPPQGQGQFFGGRGQRGGGGGGQQAGGGQRQGFGRGGFGPPVKPGMYRIVLNVDGEEFAQALSVEPDPTGASTLIAPEREDEAERDE